MRNKVIKPEWVPSAYRDDVKADIKMPVINTTAFAGKGIYIKQGLKRKYVR